MVSSGGRLTTVPSSILLSGTWRCLICWWQTKAALRLVSHHYYHNRLCSTQYNHSYSWPVWYLSVTVLYALWISFIGWKWNKVYFKYSLIGIDLILEHIPPINFIECQKQKCEEYYCNHRAQNNGFSSNCFICSTNSPKIKKLSLTIKHDKGKSANPHILRHFL